MPMVVQEKGSLYGGVSEQPPSERLSHQVEEMVNCIPTLDKGTHLRNPSLPIKLVDLDGVTAELTFPTGLESVFAYEYDEGDIALNNKSYAYLITKAGGLEIADMELEVSKITTNAGAQATAFTGEVYRDGKGINYAEQDDRDYLVALFEKGSFSMTTVRDTTFVTNKNITVEMITGSESTLYQRQGYLWIKQAELTLGWQYGCTVVIKKADGSIENIEVPLTAAIPNDTIAIASAVAVEIATVLGARADVDVVGSLVRIQLTDIAEKIEAVNQKDTFGDTASFGWGHKVDYQNQLPNTVGWFTPVVKVGVNDKGSFWITHTDGRWQEYYDPAVTVTLDAVTMPRIIEKRYNGSTLRDEYYVEKYDWHERLIGDDVTNQVPSFVGKTIKDLFFFRNRLGFITSNSIILSEVGFYANFFRTSVAGLLDSDRIDAGVESLKSINLEYSILLEDSVILFADKAQFRFRGGQILSPTAHEVTQELAYDVDIAVRPLFMDNKIFFVANRGINSAIYEMRISNNASQNSFAMDLTATCQTYIDGKIDRITGSSVSKMVFAISHFDYAIIQDPEAPVHLKRNTVFVYNFYDNGNERVQSAWHRWTFNGDIYTGFTLGSNFYTMIKRNNALTPAIWILSTGEYVFNKLWTNGGLWIMSPETLERSNQLEIMSLTPYPVTASFLDNYEQLIDGYIAFGEWMYGVDGKRSPQGVLQFRTVMVRMSENSDAMLWIKDVRRNKTRYVPSKEVKKRKPYVGGNAVNMRVGITNAMNGKGFQLEVVSYEGTMTKRTRK